MIKDFDEIKRQLEELSAVVNAFKSEAVQLRLVDLIFGRDSDPDTADAFVEATDVVQRRRKPKRAPRVTSSVKASTPAAPGVTRKARSATRLGGKSTLTRLHGEGFFKKPRTIGGIVQHAEANLATKIKQSDLSGPLARYVRDGKLKRAKNKDNQYEYVEA